MHYTNSQSDTTFPMDSIGQETHGQTDLNVKSIGDLNVHVANSQSGNNFTSQVSADFDLNDLKSNFRPFPECYAFCCHRFEYCHLPF